LLEVVFQEGVEAGMVSRACLHLSISHNVGILLLNVEKSNARLVTRSRTVYGSLDAFSVVQVRLESVPVRLDEIRVGRVLRLSVVEASTGL
jgi:hypothetical protein